MSWRAAKWMLMSAVVAWTAGLFAPRPAFSHKPITTTILFKNEVAQIFQRKCFQCHTDRNLGVSLTTYTAARPWARAIREEILERRMPPWAAVRGYGHFANDISLSAREMEIILSWTDGGAPSGVLKVEESIPPVYTPPEPSWEHGTPDRVVSLPSRTIEAGAPFSVVRAVVPIKLPAGSRIHGISLKQGDRRVVRHAAFYEESTGRWLGGWTPWQTATHLPEGLGHQLPATARLVVEIGYSGTEEAATDASEVGLYLSSSAMRPTGALALTAADAPLPPETSGHRTRGESKLTAATTVHALWPSPGPGARSIEVTATSPEGVRTPLVWVKDYRPEWRSPYMLAAPRQLAAGTSLSLTTYFDNTGDKPETARSKVWLLTSSSQIRAPINKK